MGSNESFTSVEKYAEFSIPDVAFPDQWMFVYVLPVVGVNALCATKVLNNNRLLNYYEVVTEKHNTFMIGILVALLK